MSSGQGANGMKSILEMQNTVLSETFLIQHQRSLYLMIGRKRTGYHSVCIYLMSLLKDKNFLTYKCRGETGKVL